MKSFISNLSLRKAALTVGIAFISSVFFVTLVDDFILGNFVVPGDTVALARDVEANKRLLDLAILGYLIVLVLDTIIGFALYVVLKPADKKLALLTAALRILYAFMLIVGLLVLALQIIDVYDYASLKLIAYIFFALHIFILGYTVLKSGYIPKALGILLILASFTYMVFFVELQLPETLMVIIMFTMLIAELSLSIWLIAKRKKLPEN